MIAMKALTPDLKVEWVDEFLMPGIKRMRRNPSKEEKIEYFDLAMEDNYKLIKEKLVDRQN